MTTLEATVDALDFAFSRPFGKERPEVTARRESLRSHIHAARADRRHFEEAQAILDFITSDEFKGSSEYVINLKAIAACESVSSRNEALLASAVGAYRRHQGQVAERATRPEVIEEFVGQPKDKVEVKDLTVTGHRLIDSQYGTTHLYTFLAADGHRYKWFSSNGQGWSEGDKIEGLKGTVKGHDEYNGHKSTVLTRCKAL